MADLRRRMNRLDGGIQICPGCNYPDLPLGDYEVAAYWEEAPEPEPKYCPECGREIPVFEVTWDESEDT